MRFSINLLRGGWGWALLALLWLSAGQGHRQCFAANTIVRFDTNFGMIDVELFDSAAPLTVANFLNYANSGRYQDVITHRLAPGFVLQGGAFTSDYEIMPTDPKILNEPNHTNIRGTIAMAKLGGDPNSATNQWFFNLADNSGGSPALDTQNGGFTVFGRVIGDGMSVIDSITGLPYGDFGFEEFNIDPRIDVAALPVRNYGQVEYDAGVRPDATHLLIVNDVYKIGETSSPYQNQQNHFDVANSGTILPRDLVALVDEFSRRGDSALSNNFVGPLFVDVDGNNRLNRNDIDMLADYLNETTESQINSWNSTSLLAMSEFGDGAAELDGFSFSSNSLNIAAVPEPSTCALGLLAAAGLGLLRRRWRS